MARRLPTGSGGIKRLGGPVDKFLKKHKGDDEYGLGKPINLDDNELEEESLPPPAPVSRADPTILQLKDDETGVCVIHDSNFDMWDVKQKESSTWYFVKKNAPFATKAQVVLKTIKGGKVDAAKKCPQGSSKKAIAMDKGMIIFDNEVLSPVAAWQRAQDKATQAGDTISMYSFFKVIVEEGKSAKITSTQPCVIYDYVSGPLALLLNASLTKLDVLIEWKVNQSKTFVPCGVGLCTNSRLTTPAMQTFPSWQGMICRFCDKPCVDAGINEQWLKKKHSMC